MNGDPIPADSTPTGEAPAAAGIPVTRRNYRYRLKLRPRQHRALERILEQQRLLYNGALQARIEAWRKARISVTYVDQCLALTQIRADDPEGYGTLPVTMSRSALKRLDLACQAFFSRVKFGQAPGRRDGPAGEAGAAGGQPAQGLRAQGRRYR